MRGIAFCVAVVLTGVPGSLWARGDGTFRVPLRIPLLVRPAAVAAGDFNDDGRQDLAIVGSTAVEIHLELRSGDRLGPPSTIRAGTNSFYIVASDLEGDGDDDLVVADPGNLGFVLTCRGDGTFDPPQMLTKSRGSRWITVGDLDRDGTPEIVSANHSDLSITVHTRDAAGVYTLLQRISTRAEAHTAELAELDGDGVLDLLVGLAQDGNIFMLGKGDGTFEPKSKIDSLGCIDALTLGDINKDGRVDVVANCEESAIKVAINQGDGTFKTVLTIPRSVQDLLPPVLGDFSGDGFLDMAVGGLGGGGVQIYTGKGNGELSLFTVAFHGADHTTLLAKDFDDSGRADLVSLGGSSTFATVFFGIEGELLFDGPLLAPGASPVGNVGNLVVTDFDRDGVPDVVLPDAATTGVEVIRSPGRGGIQDPPLKIPFTNEIREIAVADFDRDGFLDIAGAVRGKVAHVALLDAAGAVRKEVTLDTGDTLLPIHGVDVSGDGLPDVIGLLPKGGVALFLNQGEGAFAPRKVLPAQRLAIDVFAVDLKRDDVLDLVVNGGWTIFTWDGLGKGEFGPERPIVESLWPLRGMDIADFDRNGTIDIAATRPDASEVHVFLGDERGQFSAPAVLKLPSSSFDVRTADVDGNGFVDLVTHSKEQGFMVLLNGGGQGFGPPASFHPGLGVGSFELADLDLDGALDIVAILNSITTKFYIVLGRSAPPFVETFIRGDVDGDSQLQINDPILVLGRLFLGDPLLRCEDAADSDDSGALDLSDAVAIIAHLFLGAGPLPPPAECGEDTSADRLLPCAGGC